MENKYHLTQKQNRFLAKKNFVNMVYSNSKFEGVNTTLPQTQTIIDGMSVAGVSIDDIQVIINLKKGLEFVINNDQPYTFEISQTINRIVAAEDALKPGKIRTGNVQIGGVEYVPPVPSPDKVTSMVSTIMNGNFTDTEKALKMMYQMMRDQIFWDGNKRTAVLSANYLLINAGQGLSILVKNSFRNSILCLLSIMNRAI
ncbi:Fic family protein [Lentilactobacillus dabitei]|uniref:Fic family protein n=1 Tax=Lentilactobacillus dabitei TaxID=2831523 RepID=UPI00201C97A0|nr:Fic family protein [Lentilactobacillus dabitei]